MQKPAGIFIISLDFELLWGVRDIKTIEQYGENIRGVHRVIPRMLELFRKYDIRATFSTVGFLFSRNKSDLLAHLPERKPAYSDSNLSPYNGHFDLVRNDSKDDPYHYAPQLIQLIKQYPEQEIGTHTFSHYYCLEEGQTPEDFRADLQAAIEIARRDDINITSLVFPRNQFREDYIGICKELGITCYRGNVENGFYTPSVYGKESVFKRAGRLIDAYINLGGYNCYSKERLKVSYPFNLPASRFLRPYSPALKALEKLRLKRITSAMSHAASNGMMYHLWWHPHNFGMNQDENFEFLEKILKHYRELNRVKGFESITMSGYAKRLTDEG